MPTTVTLTPIRVEGLAMWQGASTPEQALADSDATSWVGTRRGEALLIDFGPVSGAPGPTVVTSATVKLRCVALDDITRDFFVGRLALQKALLPGGGQHVKTTTVTASETSPVNAGATNDLNATVSWSPLTIDTCSHVQVRVWADGAAADSIGIARAVLEVVYNTGGTPSAPTVTVSAPSGVLSELDGPPSVTWSSTTTQKAWQVRVFSTAQYGIGGFDAASSPATWETGPNGEDQLGVPIAATLDTTTSWRAYVRSHDGYQWSSWAYTAWSYATLPAVAVDAVSSATSHDFDVTWAFTSGTVAARQAAAQVKVFGATPSAPGTDVALWDSGVQWGSAPFATVGTWVEDTGTNEVWVRAMDADGRWSAWDGAALTLTATATSTPSGASVSWDATAGRVTMSVPACAHAGNAEVQRSTDTGTTWAPVTVTAISTSSATTVHDYRCPLGSAAIYRWRFRDTSTDSVGAWQQLDSLLVPTGVSWVKHPTDPARSRAVRVLVGASDADSDNTALLSPAGRDFPILISTGRGGDDLTVDLHATSWAAAMDLDALARCRVPLLLQRADGAQWWVIVRQQTIRPVDGAKAANWDVQWQATEVAEP